MRLGFATSRKGDLDPVLQWRRLFAGVLMCAVALIIANPMAALAANPHGTYSSSSKSCQLCHDLHSAAGDTIIVSPSEKLLCYSCHDGTGSSFNTRAAFAESILGTTTAKSSHPVPSGAMQCASCHTPHEGPSEDNIRSLGFGSADATSGVAVCGGCHGSGSTSRFDCVLGQRGRNRLRCLSRAARVF
jgi:predicted CXXCH cytochrome family protein